MVVTGGKIKENDYNLFIRNQILRDKMKKLMAIIVLSAIAMNVYAMGNHYAAYDYRVELAKQDVALAKSFVYPIAAIFAVGIGGYFVSHVWENYCIYLEKHSKNVVASNNGSYASSWAPYLKIGAGLGFAAISAYLGLKGNHNQPIAYTHKNDGGLTILSPTLIIANGSSSLAPLIPALFFIKSGFEDLRLEKKALLKYQSKKS